jgi:Transposase and inactivated derivatives
MSIREISRRTGLSRNTIRKYLRAGESEPHYAKRVSPSKLDPFAGKLAGWLKAEAGRSRKQRRTVKQMHADLQTLGYPGSYNRVAAFVRLWHEERLVAQQTTGRGTFVPLTFGPGEAFQFDWSEDWAVIAGVRTKLQVAHFKLSHSRAFYLRAYLLQTHEMLFDAHNHAFAVFGGVPRRGIYDNMRTAVDRVRRGKERDVNARFAAMASHFCSRPSSATPPPAGRRARWRRMCVMRATGCGKSCRPSRPSTISTSGWSNAARRYGARLRMASCRVP